MEGAVRRGRGESTRFVIDRGAWRSLIDPLSLVVSVNPSCAAVDEEGGVEAPAALWRPDIRVAGLQDRPQHRVAGELCWCR